MEIFISTPISSYKSKKELSSYKKSVMSLISALSAEHSVNAEIKKIYSDNDYDSPEKSIKDDLTAIANCDMFILHYPRQIPTSALMELGFAIALNKRIIIITPNRNLLPYLAQGIVSACEGSEIIERDAIDKELIQEINSYL